MEYFADCELQELQRERCDHHHKKSAAVERARWCLSAQVGRSTVRPTCVHEARRLSVVRINEPRSSSTYSKGTHTLSLLPAAFRLHPPLSQPAAALRSAPQPPRFYSISLRLIILSLSLCYFSAALASRLDDDEQPSNFFEPGWSFDTRPLPMASRRPSSSAAPPSTHLPASSTAAAEEDSPRVLTQSRPPSTIPYHLRGESFQGRVSRRGYANSPSPGSETNYPSWLPRRPAPPGPPSTFDSFDNGYPTHDRGRGALASIFGWRSTPSHSRNLTSESGYVPSSHQPHRASIDPAQPEREIEVEETQGRKATPRSVRIISVPPEARSKETSDQTRRQSSGGWGNYSTGHVRAFSRGAANPYTTYMRSHSPLPALSWPSDPLPTRVAPRFKARSLNLGLLRSTSRFDRLRFHFSPLTYFAHVPVQLFFDFNAIYILTQCVLSHDGTVHI